MATTSYVLRKHWKKCAFGTVAVFFGARYLAKRFRQSLIVRDYCEKAKVYGEQKAGLYERPRKIMVFLNPKANKTEAKAHFTKYAAPLLHLSGAEITIVESDYAGQIRTLMGYIDPQTDGIVVAGGDGTLAEVVNGLMRRFDSSHTRSIPIGVIPLGRENKFYQSHRSTTLSTSPARRIGEATMDIIVGNATPAHLIELQPESGRTLYAFSTVEWGAFKEAYENRDSFKLLGKLRLFFSYLNTAVRKWPVDYHLRLWLPAKALLLTENGGSPPSQGSSVTQARPVSSHQHESSEKYNHGGRSYKEEQMTFKSVRDSGTSFLLPYAECLHLPDIQKGQEGTFGSGGGSESPSVSRRTPSQLTPLAVEVDGRPDWKHVELDVVGFRLSHSAQALGAHDQSPESSMKLTVWPLSTPKGSFIRQGWMEARGKSPIPLPAREFQSPEFILQPVMAVGEQSWLSVDGEAYEAMPVALRVLPNALRLFTCQRKGSITMPPSGRTLL